MFLRSIPVVLFFALTATSASAQNGKSARIEILNADVWEFDEKLAPGAQRLKGSVRFRHENAIMRCDSAYLYDDQSVEAFGHVNIDQGDTLFVDGDRLKYNGQQRRARLDGNVRLRDKDMELTTPSLDYDMNDQRAVYTEGGTLVSRIDNSRLTSEAGVYNTESRVLVFSRNVRLDHPERTIISDTMHYGTSSGVAEFFGPTTITQDSTVIETTRGTYDTKAEQARFSKRSSILTKGRLLEGDSMYYEKRSGIGQAWGNVSVSDTASDVIARGDQGKYDEINDRSMITGNAELVMIMDADSLFLHGDSIFTFPDTSGAGRVIQAHRGVRFFKSDMQGVCDTLIYSEADSLIRMMDSPAIWSGTDQITGDRISIQMKEEKPHRLHVDRNAFLISKVDSVHLDQVSGTKMTGYFENSELNRIIAEGNSRTIYFGREEKDGKEEIIGVNRADCSKIDVWLDEGQVSTITFQERPDATLYPLAKVPPEELLMNGAIWRGDERPADRISIFNTYEAAPVIDTPLGSTLQKND
ncbi:MAG: hypothetical protein M3R08_03990 [Bacteroidota bacterium]|nr:hypothetical protein [Bacteroidota bacterium]